MGFKLGHYRAVRCFAHMYWTMLPVVGRGTKPAYADFLTRPNIIAEYGVTVNDKGEAA